MHQLLTSLRNCNTPDRTFTVLLSTNKPTNESLYKKRRKNQKKKSSFFFLDLNKQIFECLFMIGYDDLCMED